ncbi:MAG: sugar nucleotide-binding protein [Winogradskyella sp.]|uniref:sugar nucleotide-binding protein n=1 Tax=Winogradskyella sp. TaxID=1883156 RepID=UPI0017D287A4|nr:sugar nucleotide-binding protein [Winogradskyella sp.]MBT8245121.1 sugar nucleotide-binding protein [Winogradskyella sp.]NNK22393.1 sugar nucleotide-binding protein [Winogradskyella sp.]
MKKIEKKYRILVLGASGYLGSSIYKELCSYFNTYGTYFSAKKEYEKNKHFFHYNVEEDDLYKILEVTNPDIIISALRGNFHAQTIAHGHLTEYALEHNSKIIFMSSANAFDAYSKYPSYETDKTLSHSIYGHFKIKIENMLMRMPKRQYVILRLPMVFGNNCPRISEMKQLISEKESVEIFPNLIMNVTLDKKVTQQIHYIINRNKSGVFHLGSTDLVHHDEFIKELTSHLFTNKVSFKNVYTTNDDRYLAVLPKYNLLPKHLQITSYKVLEELKK